MQLTLSHNHKHIQLIIIISHWFDREMTNIIVNMWDIKCKIHDYRLLVHVCLPKYLIELVT